MDHGLRSAQDESVDIVFVVDASNSMRQNDPGDLRATFIRAAVDFLQGRGGDRVAIVQFAGWFETQAGGRKVVVFPLTQIPRPGAGQAFKRGFRESLERLETYGQASDINAAFEQGLKEIAQQRGSSKNPWWVVLVTDGDFDVLEPDRVRPEYLERAGKKPSGADVDTINEAAFEIFHGQVRPEFVKASGSRPLLSALSLARDRSAEQRIRDIVGEGKVCRPTATPLKDLLAPLLGESPLLRKGQGGFYGYVRGQTSIPVHVYEGASRTAVIVFCQGSDLKAKLKQAAGQVEVLGDGSYQVLHLREVPPGDYLVEVEGAKEGLEAIVWADFKLRASARTAQDSVYVGDPIAVEMRVDHDGRPVTSARFLKDLAAKVVVEKPSGARVARDVTFQDSALGSFEMPADEAGTYALKVDLSAVPDGTYQPRAFYAGPYEFKVTARYKLEAGFAAGSIPLGDDVVLRVRPVNARPPHDLIQEVPIRAGGEAKRIEVAWKAGAWEASLPGDKLTSYELMGEETERYVLVPSDRFASTSVVPRRFEATFSRKTAFERQPVELVVQGKGEPDAIRDVRIRKGDRDLRLPVQYDESARRWEAHVDTGEPTEVEIVEESTESTMIVAKPHPKLSVRKRAFRVFEEKGGRRIPVTDLVLDVKYREPGRYVRNMVLTLDVGEREHGEVTARMTSRAGQDAFLELRQGGAKLPAPWPPLTAMTAERTFQLALVVDTDAVLPERIGLVAFEGTVAGMTFSHEVRIRANFPDKTSKIFKKLFPFGIGAGVLLAALCGWLLLARWKDHQLRLFQNSSLETRHYLRDLNAGFNRRTASGTPEVPESLYFQIRGLKIGKPAIHVRPGNANVAVQGAPVLELVPLRNGDEVVVEADKTLFRYIYFQREPGSDELAAALAGLIAGDEIFLEEE
ncbi:MAG: VWA domain-containing protein [Planctomycetes bacterium]|nr:VWA domain-containing protein [Planctomycetota bacterium]